MSLAPYNLKLTDGATVVWCDDNSVGAVKLHEILYPTDGPRCVEFKLCYHHHYFAKYESSSFKCHLWEFLDIRKLTTSELERRQDDLAACVVYFLKTIEGQNTTPKCVGCGLGEFLLVEQCPVCENGLPMEWNRCFACSLRSRNRLCDHADSISHPNGIARPMGLLAKRQLEKRKEALAVVLESGPPPVPTSTSDAEANLVSPAHKSVRRGLAAVLNYPAHDLSGYVSPPSAPIPANQSTPYSPELDCNTMPRQEGPFSEGIGTVAMFEMLLHNQQQLLSNQQKIQETLAQLMSSSTIAANVHSLGMHGPPASFASPEFGTCDNFGENLDGDTNTPAAATVPGGTVLITTPKTTGAVNFQNPDFVSPTANDAHPPSFQFNVIPPSKIKILALQFVSRTEFTLNLLRFLFKDEELVGHNCTGTCGKQKLDSVRLEYLKKIVLEAQPPKSSETEDTAWGKCRRAIDGRSRYLTLRQLKKPTNFGQVGNDNTDASDENIENENEEWRQ